MAKGLHRRINSGELNQGGQMIKVTEYKIMAKCRNCPAEEVDSTESKSNAEYLAREYQMAFGSDSRIWIKPVQLMKGE